MKSITRRFLTVLLLILSVSAVCGAALCATADNSTTPGASTAGPPRPGDGTTVDGGVNTPTESSPPTESETTTAPKDEERSGFFATVRQRLSELLDFMSSLTRLLDPGAWITAALTTFQNTLNSTYLEIMDKCISLANNLGSDLFFGNAFVKESLAFFQWFAAILLAAGFLVELLKSAERSAHGERISFAEGVFGLLKGYGMILFVYPVMMCLMDIFTIISNALCNIGISSPPFVETLQSTLSDASLVTLFVSGIVTLTICIVSVMMLVRIFRRFAIMYIQILTGYLYVYDLAKGNNVLGEWGRDVIAGFITFHLELTMYNVGLKLLAIGISETGSIFSFLNGNTFVGLTFLFSVGIAPLVLRRWGYANQSSHRMGQMLMQGASTTASIAARFIV